MIVALAEQVRNTLSHMHQLEVAQSEVENIEATLAELRRVDQALDSLSVTLRIIQQRLPNEIISILQSQANKLATDIESSRAAFTQNRRQVDSLRTIQSKLQKISTDIANAWASYAEQRFMPHREILELVRRLPEVAAQDEAISRLVDQIQAQVRKSPGSTAELGAFDARIADLSQRLALVEQLAPAIREFLGKVRDERATVADLTPEVLSWLQKSQHTTAFAISFTERKGTGR